MTPEAELNLLKLVSSLIPKDDPLEERFFKKVRPVSAMLYRNGENIQVEGHFHGWTTDYEELNNGVGQYPAGVIELADGTIVVAAASCMKFLDRTGGTSNE